MDDTRPPVVDTDRVTITKGDVEFDLWLHGTVNDQPGYTFSVQAFNSASPYGIDFSLVSKLEVRNEGEIVCQYNRGWIEMPMTAEDRRAVDTIISSFREYGSERVHDSVSRDKDNPGHER